MSKIATISCIILAVSINFEGIQASILNPIGSVLDNVQKRLESGTIQETKPFPTVGANFGADLTTVNYESNELSNENKGIIQTASIFTCAKLVNEAGTIIKKLKSNFDSCTSSSTNSSDADIQAIRTLLNNLTNNVTEEIKKFISQHSNSIIAAIPDLLKELPKWFNEQHSTIEEILSKILDLFTVVPKCFVNLYFENVQQDVHQFIKDANECYQSIPL